jgi:alpha/beta superfamily hydrolase
MKEVEAGGPTQAGCLANMNMVARSDVYIPCGSIVLEGVLEIPETQGRLVGGAVICHPHPLFGGNMYNNVVRALKKAAADRGLISLRFNFRGTGKSEGTYGQGVDEVEDVKAALDFLVQVPEVDSGKIIVAGYSFGCWVGLKAAVSDARPARLVGISPPVNEYDFSFLANEKRPKLLVAGDRDFVCSVPGFQELVESIPEPKAGRVLQGVDHFHMGNEDNLIHEFNEFLEKFPLGE